MDKGTEMGYHQMLCPSFLAINSTTQFTLADLSVTGYDPSTPGATQWSGGCKKNNFLLKELNKNGTTKAVYGWADATTGKISAPTTLKRGWYRLTGATFTTWPDEPMTTAEMKEVSFDAGKAFWVKAASISTLQLQSAGAVKEEDFEIPTEMGYHVSAGNGTAADLTLGDLYVTGYDPSTPGATQWSGGCKKNNFLLKELNKNGTTKAVYGWADCTTGKVSAPTTLKRGWYRLTGDTFTVWPDEPMTTEEMAAVEIPAGKGFWIKAASISTLKLYVPAPELD